MTCAGGFGVGELKWLLRAKVDKGDGTVYEIRWGSGEPKGLVDCTESSCFGLGGTGN